MSDAALKHYEQARQQMAETFEDLCGPLTGEMAAPAPEPETRQRSNPGHAMLAAARIRTEAQGEDPFADRAEARARDGIPGPLATRGAGGEIVPVEQIAE